jgi:P-type Ca2+ transporter type 2C
MRKERMPLPTQNETLQNAWTFTAESLLKIFNVTKDQGLSTSQVQQQLEKYGPNQLRQTKAKSGWVIFIAQFKSLIVALLGAAVIISFAFKEYMEAWAIVVVIFINAAIGFFTERKAVRSMEALKKLERVDARVRRNGQDLSIPAQELVPGDIVLLEGGDIVSADMAIVEASKLQVDESALTGESLPVDKKIQILPAETLLAERTNMLYKGTAITRGSANALVVATGMQTELGIITALVDQAKEESTPLQERLEQLGQKLIWLTLTITAIIAILGMIRGKEFFIMIETAIALSVAAIPEGLPIVATIALARGMLLMAKRNALIRQLASVETLGATNVICTDKTGTLTENKMTVTHIVLESGAIEVHPEQQPFRKNEKPMDPRHQKDLLECLKTAMLCNNAFLTDKEADAGIGDPMEIALLDVGHKAGLLHRELLFEMPEVREEAFDSDIKMMATFHQSGDGYFVAVKGAPENVFAHCIDERNGDHTLQLTPSIRKKWQDRNNDMAKIGLRVLGIAMKKVMSQDASPYESLTFLGLIGLMDPARADVSHAIQMCHDAGIRVIMVTGDQAVTAETIAKKIGLVDNGETEVLPGTVLHPLEELTAEETKHILAASIFARVSPKQKLDLIDIHQHHNSIVAMTGDGVNDAPALKKADIGIAMGLRGTQVAREAANMVLKDDSFSTIVVAIQQGRIIFNNIRKFVIFLLSCNLSEILTIALASFVNGPMPILPLQILFINLVTDIFPALALGVGEGDPKVMRHPPRDPREPFIQKKHWYLIAFYSIIMTLSVLGALAIALMVFHFSMEQSVTISFLTLTLAQLWHVFNMSERASIFRNSEIVHNPWIWGALALCTLLVLVFVFTPVLAGILNIHPIGKTGWLIVMGMSMMTFFVGQMQKIILPRLTL